LVEDIPPTKVFWFRRTRWGWKAIHWKGHLIRGFWIVCALAGMVTMAGMEFRPPSVWIFLALMTVCMICNAVIFSKTENA
jgi:hypothetical protein